MLLPLIGAGASLVSSLVGGISSAKKKRESEKLLEQQRDTLEKWYDKEMNNDYLDSAVAKSTLSYLSNQNREKERESNNSIVKNNSTAEERVALASALNRSYAEAATKLSAQGEDLKTKASDYYLAQSEKLNNETYNTTLSDAITKSGTSSLGASIGNSLALIGSLSGETKMTSN